MMGSLLDVAVRRAGEGGFDKPVAILAGGAAAALGMLMPLDALQNLVIDSGLPFLLAAAEPPLGMKARLLLAGVGGVVAFAVIFGVMRLIGRKPARPTRWGAEDGDTGFEAAPRMRRRDLHPDAPTPAPISALRDLGEPGVAKASEPPLILTEPLPEPVAEAEEEELILCEADAIDEPAPAPATAPVVGPAPPRVQAQGQETIAELLSRLERAIEKKPLPQWLERPSPVQAQPVPANEEEEETPVAMDDRLRSALANLKRFAPAHG